MTPRCLPGHPTAHPLRCPTRTRIPTLTSMWTPWPNRLIHHLPPRLLPCTAQTLNKILLCHLCPLSNSKLCQQKHFVLQFLLLCLQLLQLLFHTLPKRPVLLLLLLLLHQHQEQHHRHQQESQRCLPAASRPRLAPHLTKSQLRPLLLLRTSSPPRSTCARSKAVARSLPVHRTCGPTRPPTRASSPFLVSIRGASPSLHECTI